MSSVGSRLKEFAESNFKSTADFARHFGKSRSYFHPYFAGTTMPGGEILKRLAEIGCDINWLLTGQSSTPDANEPKFISSAGVKKDSEFENLISHYEKIIEQKNKVIEQLSEILQRVESKK